ncbi:MAG: GatB/YqeY domain-containing protein [Bacteroidota bacterium]|nr:GatB/YqeY domain-containing protein [Bacteroidota bacterium]
MLFDIINEDLKSAMRAKDKAALRGIRAVKSALLLLKTNSSAKEITKDDEIKILQKLVKQRKESIIVYTEQGRDELAKEETEELEVIQKYLPKQLSKVEIEKVIAEVIIETSAKSMADMGKIMAVAMKKFGGQADGKTISAIVKEKLS